MKLKKLLSLAMATIIISGYTPITETVSFSNSMILETSAASNSKLKAPAGIKSAATANSIVLQWNKITGSDGYRIYMYDSSKKKYVKYKSVSGTKCTVSNLKANTEYYFKITALVKNNDKYSAQEYSEKISVTTKKLAAPQNITATTNYSSVEIKWGSIKGADAYRVYQYDSSSKKYVTVTTTSSTNYTAIGLTSGKTYKFKVAALIKNGQNYSAQTVSSVISATTTTDAKLQTADFTVYDKNGNEVKLSDYAGKPIVVNIWASWCGPCRSELPYFDTLYNELGDDVVFMMVNSTGGRETKDVAKDFIKDKGYGFPLYFDSRHRASSAYSVSAIPTTLFIDRDGKLVHKEIGAMDEDELRDFIDNIL
ncbi:MAG: redoxin family protein [Eubacterium sp.]|nr:redoxin family protein [Eubacterium sp.]